MPPKPADTLFRGCSNAGVGAAAANCGAGGGVQLGAGAGAADGIGEDKLGAGALIVGVLVETFAAPATFSCVLP